MRVPTWPVHCFLLASDAQLCVRHEWGRVLTFELLRVRLLVSFSWLRWHLSFLLPVNMPAHTCMCMYLCLHTHIHGIYFFFSTPHKHTCACLLIERGLFPQACGSWWEVRTEAWFFPSSWHQGKEESESGHLGWVGFTVFPAHFPAMPFCQHLCPPIALGYVCRSPLTVGSSLLTAVFYHAWQGHLCRLRLCCIPAREGRGAVWLDQCHWKLQTWLYTPSCSGGGD